MSVPDYLLNPIFIMPNIHQIEENPVVWRYGFSGIIPWSDKIPKAVTEHACYVTAQDGWAVYNRVDNSNDPYNFWKCVCGRKNIFSPCICGKRKPD